MSYRQQAGVVVNVFTVPRTGAWARRSAAQRGSNEVTVHPVSVWTEGMLDARTAIYCARAGWQARRGVETAAFNVGLWQPFRSAIGCKRESPQAPLTTQHACHTRCDHHVRFGWCRTCKERKTSWCPRVK